jgi:hypothetical protein
MAMATTTFLVMINSLQILLSGKIKTSTIGVTIQTEPTPISVWKPVQRVTVSGKQEPILVVRIINQIQITMVSWMM